jgi:hypothetical protein
MTEPATPPPTPPAGHPYGPDIAAEREGWYAIMALVRTLTRDECLEPGYYRDPDWSVRDLVAHLGTWLAEAQAEFERMSAGTYEAHEVNVDALNATFHAAMADQPWDVAWIQANAARTRMLEEWYALREPNVHAGWWIHKSASDHSGEHLERLRAWVAELIARRPGLPASR